MAKSPASKAPAPKRPAAKRAAPSPAPSQPPAAKRAAPSPAPSQRPARPEGMPWLSPYLTVRDASAAIAFYEKAFGFKTKNVMPGPDGKPGHVEMSWKDALIMLASEGAFGGTCKAPATSGALSPVTLYVYCDDVDALHAKATAAGAKTAFPPTTMFWGDRLCKLTDPDGHVWNFATNVADFDPSNTPK